MGTGSADRLSAVSSGDSIMTGTAPVDSLTRLIYIELEGIQEITRVGLAW
jgi:hypothetical protein